MRITVTPDISSLRRALNGLGADAVRAEVRALNRTIESVKVQASRALADDTGLTRRAVDRSLSVSRASFSAPEATLTVTGQRIPLIEFGARQTRRGVTYRMPARGRSLIPSAFIGRMRSGHVGVFRRESAQGPLRPRRKRGGRRAPAAGVLMVGRLPIQERFGPSLPRVFVQDKIRAALEQHARATFDKTLAHEIQFIGSQRGAA